MIKYWHCRVEKNILLLPLLHCFKGQRALSENPTFLEETLQKQVTEVEFYFMSLNNRHPVVERVQTEGWCAEKTGWKYELERRESMAADKMSQIFYLCKSGLDSINCMFCIVSFPRDNFPKVLTSKINIGSILSLYL